MIFFFFNDTATTEIYTLSLHDALPILMRQATGLLVSATYPLFSYPVRAHHKWCSSITLGRFYRCPIPSRRRAGRVLALDRKSTRLNSSHANISYAVFCLKKKKQNSTTT